MKSTKITAGLFTEAFSDFIKERNINIYRVTAISDDGESETVTFQDCNPCQNSYSISKFFTLTAVGLLWDEGLIKTDEKLTDIFGSLCPSDMPSEWNEKTVEMAILHHCGLPTGYLDIDAQNAVKFGRDYLSYVLSTPLNSVSGFSYTDAEFYLLARAVSIRAGKPILEYLWDKLFWPLGFREVAWSSCPMNYSMGATGLYIRTEDMAKLGAVYLNKGTYNGRRILSEKWIDMVLEKGYLPSYTQHGYGHGGMAGQMLVVFPKAKLTVAWHGFHDEGEEITGWIEKFLSKDYKEIGDN